MIDIGLYDYAEDEELPKRSDYDEIRTFQDYEFTQCVVYELAIRNPQYKKEVAYVMEFYTKYKEYIDLSINNHGLPATQGTRTHHPKFKELKRMIENIEVIPFNIEKNTLEYKDVDQFGVEFYELLDLIMKKQSEKDCTYTISNDQKKYLDKTNILEGEGFWVETQIESVIYPSFKVIDPNHEEKTTIKHTESLENFFTTAKKYNEDITSKNIERRLRRMNVLTSEIRVHEHFKRPKLRFNRNTTKHVIAEIDLSRPEEEISAYIKHLKMSLKDNSEIITPMQLLASLFEPENQVISNEKKFKADSKASLFAEKLFKYDYITTKIKNNKANNAFYEKQIRKIQDESEDSFFLNKTERIQEAKAHYADNKAITASSTLMKQKEILEAIGEKPDTLRGHYNSINSLLINERYKGLLSDI